MDDPVTRTENWLTSLLVAIVLLVCGLLLVFLAGRVSTLSCSRETGSIHCLLSSRLLDQYLPRETVLNNLQSAYVDESCDDSCSYRVRLITANDDTPFTTTLDSNRTEKQALADQINQFIQDSSQKSLILVSDVGLWPYAGMIVTVIGLFISLWTGVKAFLSIVRTR